tara:strand:- start:64 stop:330 length:267 start_codon:yes stop_codon:yes gene_type:complete
MCGGGGQKMPEPLTKEEIIKNTDNPFENPNSGVSAPSWKEGAVADEKAAMAAAEKATARTVSAEVTPRRSKMGVVKRKKFNKRTGKKR